MMMSKKDDKPPESFPAGSRRDRPHAEDGWHIDDDGERNAGSDALPKGLRPGSTYSARHRKGD
jgi:hypothetical protein